MEYRDYDAKTETFKDAVRECAFVTDETRVLEDGWWYAVKGTVAIPDGITVKGSVHLVLCDGASLTANCTNALPGVSVRPGNTLAIYGQTAGTGTLTAGGESGAGIGGGHEDWEDPGLLVVSGGAVAAQRQGDGVLDIGFGPKDSQYTQGVFHVSCGIFSLKPLDKWLDEGRCRAPNMDLATADAYPWRVVESNAVVTIERPAGPFPTAEEATNAWASVEFVPSDDVADVLTTRAARRSYAGWFDLGVTSKDASEWYVEAALTDEAKLYLAETAANATQQIPVAEIAALTEEGTTTVTVEDCEPGFYYTLYGAATLPKRGGLGETAPRVGLPCPIGWDQCGW